MPRRDDEDHFLVLPCDRGDLTADARERNDAEIDLIVEEAHRRRGYAEEAMRLAEAIAREKGASRISLHVFAHNVGARRLYDKLGYEETNVVMSKVLAP